jgi:tRNA (guanine-N7-)-methyltransferase
MTNAFAGYETRIPSKVRILGPGSFFSGASSLEIEIGCGKGLFLTEHALAHPERFLIGIEASASCARLAEEKVLRRALRNAQVLAWPAEAILPFFVSRCASRFHIYFPDPWPKRRHARRRLWSEPFLRELERILQDEGRVYFATDHESYYDAILRLLEDASAGFRIEREAGHRFFEDAKTATAYEKKFAREGRQIRYLSLIKKASGGGP